MYFLHKRHLVWLLLLIYSLSYFLQSWFFVDLWSVFAENPLERTHLVAVFVDKDIYQDTKTDVEWYATSYIQQRVSNSKALILPINVKNFKAIDLVKMLENMYFDGVKWTSSDLLWAIFVWDIPLPVVQNKWFIYPTIFPYVDFEDQQFVYDANQQFFVYNNNPRWQAEIWHWILNFWSDVSLYHNFFQKLRTYTKNPTSFVAPLMWYDDFIGVKNTFSQDTLPFYVNNFLFTEDVGYHRFTNLMLDYFKTVQNDNMSDLLSSFSQTSSNNPELQATISAWKTAFDNLSESKVPTTMLLSVIKELLAKYDKLYPWVFLATMKDNAQAAARWYKKTGSGDWVDWIDSHIHKLLLKDSLAVWDPSKWISPVIVSFNDLLEKSLDDKIESNRWYMTLPIINKYTHEDWTKKKNFGKRWCQKITDDIYQNYYFWTYAGDIVSADQFSIYRGTYRNLSSFSGVVLVDTWYISSDTKSLWSSNHVFATQIEANRWYNLMSAASDYDTYSENKIKEKRTIVCSKWVKFLGFKLYCKTRKGEYVWNTYESIEDFWIRGRWWASALLLDSGALAAMPPTYVLGQYDYKSAFFPIYDIWWSVAVATWKADALSYLANSWYASLIKTKDQYGSVDYPKYIKWDTDNYPSDVYSSKDKDWYRKLIDTNRIWTWYTNFDYFLVWKRTSDTWSKTKKVIDVNGTQKNWTSSDSMWGKCSGKRETFSYFYSTIDSRVKSVSPTAEQVNWIYGNEFSKSGIFWKHYDYLKQELVSINESSYDTFTFSLSGLSLLLSWNKEVNAKITTFAALSSTDPVLLLSWVQQIFPQDKQLFYNQTASWVFSSLDQGLDGLLQLNFGNVLAYFDRIKEVETLYNQETTFLSGWSNDLKTTVSSIKTKYLSLPAVFNQISSTYQTISTTNAFATWALVTKRNTIDTLQNCGTSVAPNYCWCKNTYKQVCDTIDSLVVSLGQLAKNVSTLERTTVVEEIDGVSSSFDVELLSSFSSVFEEASAPDGFLSDIPLVLSGISQIKTIAVEPPLQHTPWFNQTTADRPIDWPRKISFQGLGGTLVSFSYPNLYEVSVYKNDSWKLLLKNVQEIEASILEYLTEKAKEYNQILLNQEKNRAIYYAKNPSAFDFLEKTDPLATPKNRTTSYLPEMYFVDLLWKQRISNIAELLYYQTLPVSSRFQTKYIDEDLEETRSQFDVNKKISYIVSWYLTEHPDQWPLVSPAYNASWYEVAYINSDGSDLVSASAIPPLVKKIQESQKSFPNTFLESSELQLDPLFDATKRYCWLDSSYTALLFDIGKWTMPWIDAVKCWLTTLRSSAKFDISMEMWPSLWAFFSWLQSSFDSRKSSFSSKNNAQDLPGATFSGNIWEYRTNIVLNTGDDESSLPKIKSLSFQFPTKKLLAWSEMPITFSAKDFSGNVLKRALTSYVVSVLSGNGSFLSVAGSDIRSEEFFDIENTMLLYKAPLVSKPTSIPFVFSWQDFSTQQSLLVTPGDLSITFWSKKVYANNKQLWSLSFALTWVDATYSTVPRIFLSLTAQDGSPLETSLSVLSKNGLVVPWVVSSWSFVPLQTYFLEKQNQAIFLMPTYRAGTDELYIQIPGLDPIVLSITIAPGFPYRVNLSTSSSMLPLWSSVTGSVFVTDAWGNTLPWKYPLRLGSYWALDFDMQTVSVWSDPYIFSTKTKSVGGVSYLYAYLDTISFTDQSPDYKKITVQETILPSDKLNVMYLNLFGSDWWNIWTTQQQFSVPQLMSSSNKLLAVTTQITDPSRLKKFAFTLSQKAQIRNFSEYNATLSVSSWMLLATFDSLGYIPLASEKDLKVFSSQNVLESLTMLSDKNIPAFVLSNTQNAQFQVTEHSLSFENQLLFDFKKNIWNSGFSLSLSSTMNQWYSVWDMFYDDERIGSLYFIQSVEADVSKLVLYNMVSYSKDLVFAEGSTNAWYAIWIVDLQWSFEKEWYLSIEDSSRYDQWIWFRSDFKNITLFGDWKTVWEATIPFWSQFLINFWDPLLSRISKNVEISSVQHDLWVGEQVYTHPSKAIFKTLHTDINNDGLIDILIVFTDWTIKLLKNYWWTHPYTNLQDLIRLADSIKDVYVWDVDNNRYPDILVWTNNDQLRVYKNEQGVLDVDGNMVCLNINANWTKINNNPESVAWLQQLFFEDMDKDGNIDIVTNDNIGDIKIFYWWATKGGQSNYVSTLQYACDSGWYSRQKNNIRLVKSYGIVVDADSYVQDESMIHLKWRNISEQAPVSQEQIESISPNEALLEKSQNVDIASMVGSLSTSFQWYANDSLSKNLSVSPLSYIPRYENRWLEDIWYKNLLQLSWDESISVYKQYKDKNWGVLLSWDVVTITTTILSLKNWVQATYLDRLSWPWQIATDDDNRILSFVKKSWNFSTGDIVWTDSDAVLFVLDDISLNTRQSLSFSYDVVYLWGPTVSIQVKDILFSDLRKKKDLYADIIVSPLDSCKKYRRVFFNTTNQSHRSYEEVFDNIQLKLDAYTAEGQKEGQSLFSSSMPALSSWLFSSTSATDYQNGANDFIKDIPGLSQLYESWNVPGLFSSSQGNISLDMKALDAFMAPVSEEIDKILDGLCEWFKLGSKGACQPPVPFNKIPFNQAFLAPWDYHLFGCWQELMTALNKTLGKWWPVLSVPGNRWPTPVWYIPAPNIFGFPFKWPTDGHLWWPKIWSWSSQVRVYAVPTLTLQMGIAICFWPYPLWVAVPPLVRDLWWNCVVAAFPMYACNGSSGNWEEPATEELDNWMADLAANGSCEQPILRSSAKVLANTILIQQPTYPSSFRLSSLWSQNSSWTMAVPNWNFGGFGYVSLSWFPTRTSTTSSSVSGWFNFDALRFVQWAKIDLKIKDSNAQGIIKWLVKDWLGRQVKYMINNLTKLTVNVTLPDVSQLADGFDSLFSATDWSDASQAAKEDDVSSYDDLNSFKEISSRQWYQAMTAAANNPFESLVTIFQSIPLVDLYTKDIVLKIPLPTSDELLKYDSYLRGWLKNQQWILKQWLEAIHEIASICWTTTPSQAEEDLLYLNKEIEEIKRMPESDKLLPIAQKEKEFLETVLQWKVVTQSSHFLSDDVPAVLKDIGNQFTFFSQKLVALPRLKATQAWLRAKPSPSDADKQLLVHVSQRIESLSSCATFSANIDDFTSFYNQSSLLIRNVQKNIQVLQEYKKFPMQLYDWMHFIDRYMADILNFVSKLSSTLIWWVNVNAKIYTKWVDALVLILSTIKTWQVLIDLSTNWTKKCGKCSRDGYGAHSCSLWFLFPKIPIIPIPPFKIPNINIDLSHIDLGISMALPRFLITPVDFPMPKLPDLPSPPNYNLAAGLNFSVQFDYSLPEIPVLPSPPELPELPSFIPKIDFSLPLLPPAPKIPNIIPQVSSIIEIADFVTKIFCILKKWFGLVSEKWVKTKVEQMTQRTWDVPIFDFFDQTFTWQTDKKPQWFDFQIDWFLQFTMDFSPFYWFLNQIAETVNGVTYKVTSSYAKGLSAVNSWLQNNAVVDFLNKDIKDLDMDFTVPPLDFSITPLSTTVETIDYDVAYKQLSLWLKEFSDRVEDQDIQKEIKKITSVLQTPIVINPAVSEIQNAEKEIQNILLKKQKEVRELAKSIKSYDMFVANVKKNDVALVSDDHIEASFDVPLFTTTDETYAFLEQQESPLKTYMDTNASLVNGYLTTLTSSSPDELSMTKVDYEKTTNYLQTMKSKIDSVYETLWFDSVSYMTCGLPYLSDEKDLTQQPLLAQANTNSVSSTAVTSDFASDISSYVRWVFVENSSWNKVNVVKSEKYVSAVSDNYFEADLNQDTKKDLLLWDTNTVYVKYANQKSVYQNTQTTKSFYVYSPKLFASSYIDSYGSLFDVADANWYVEFGNVFVKLVSSTQEVKNFKMAWQSFDAIKMSWTNLTSLWESVDWYLIKLNHRIDTYHDKDINFRFLDDKFLNKRYILVLPTNTQYTSATIDFKERYYYKGKDADKPRNVSDFLSGGQYSGLILTMKFYQPTQQILSIGLGEIPRNWQYAEIVPLKNIQTPERPFYVPHGPRSNQIVAGRQILADMIWPEAVITLERPSINQTISTWSRHKWFVWTYYNLVARWSDNVAVSRMWINDSTKELANVSGTAQTGIVLLSWLYFTGKTTLEYLMWAEDFNGNRQVEKVSLDIDVPSITVKDFVPLSEYSWQLVAEISQDIDEWMVIFQRQRNDSWQEMSWTLANAYWGFSIGPKQTIVTWSVFSLWNTVGLYDTKWVQIWQISIDWNINIFDRYADLYDIQLDLSTGAPLVRVLHKQLWSTVFWIQMPSYSLVNLTLYQKEPFYSKVDLTQSTFGAFLWWYCIQSLDKECVLYISSQWQLYIPKISSTSLIGEYRYDTNTRSVVYVIKDFLGKEIVMVTTKTRLMK